MGGIVKQFMYSRAAWFLGVVAWIWIAGEHWYDVLAGGFSAINITQVVIATFLAVLFLAAFVANRGWEKRSGSNQGERRTR